MDKCNFELFKFSDLVLNYGFFPSSLGLAIPPRIRFLKREEKRKAERESQKKATLEKLKEAADEEEDTSESDGESSESEGESETEQTISQQKSLTDKHSEDSDSSQSDSESERTSRSEEKLNFNLDDDNEDLFTVKRTILPDSDSEEEKGGISVKEEKEKKAQTKYALAKKLQKKNVKVNTKVTFDEEGEVQLIDTHKLSIFPEK